jgi:hypothetical protein
MDQGFYLGDESSIILEEFHHAYLYKRMANKSNTANGKRIYLFAGRRNIIDK